MNAICIRLRKGLAIDMLHLYLLSQPIQMVADSKGIVLQLRLQDAWHRANRHAAKSAAS